MKKISSTILFSKRNITIVSDQFENGERIQDYIYVRKNGGVVVLGELENSNVVFINQYRYLVDEICLELPAGGIEEGELPLEAAKREFLEETGFTAKTWVKKYVFYPSNGFCDEKVYVFFAKGLKKDNNQIIDKEITNVVEVDSRKLKQLIERGSIKGASSLIAIYLYITKLK
jgi:ADP-ribose pyrophosphatase